MNETRTTASRPTLAITLILLSLPAWALNLVMWIVGYIKAPWWEPEDFALSVYWSYLWVLPFALGLTAGGLAAWPRRPDGPPHGSPAETPAWIRALRIGSGVLQLAPLAGVLVLELVVASDPALLRRGFDLDPADFQLRALHLAVYAFPFALAGGHLIISASPSRRMVLRLWAVGLAVGYAAWLAISLPGVFSPGASPDSIAWQLAYVAPGVLATALLFGLSWIPALRSASTGAPARSRGHRSDGTG